MEARWSLVELLQLWTSLASLGETPQSLAYHGNIGVYPRGVWGITTPRFWVASPWNIIISNNVQEHGMKTLSKRGDFSEIDLHIWLNYSEDETCPISPPYVDVLWPTTPQFSNQDPRPLQFSNQDTTPQFSNQDPQNPKFSNQDPRHPKLYEILKEFFSELYSYTWAMFFTHNSG